MPQNGEKRKFPGMASISPSYQWIENCITSILKKRENILNVFFYVDYSILWHYSL